MQVRIFVYVSAWEWAVSRESGEKPVRTVLFVCPALSNPDFGIFDYSLSLSLALWIFHVLYHVVFQCLPRIPVSRRFAAEMLSAVLCSVPPCIMLGPYQSRWLTVGRRLKPYLSNLRDKRTHCISNIRNTLERRRESGDARHTVQPQTVWVICFPSKASSLKW